MSENSTSLLQIVQEILQHLEDNPEQTPVIVMGLGLAYMVYRDFKNTGINDDQLLAAIRDMKRMEGDDIRTTVRELLKTEMLQLELEQARRELDELKRLKGIQ